MMHEVLFVSDGIVHPPLLARRAVRGLMDEMLGLKVNQTRSLNDLVGFDLSQYSALVLYYHHERLLDAALDLMQEFVISGGGLLAIHSATASFEDQPRYFQILGGRFVEHGPVEPFTINPEPGNQKIFDGIAPFTVKDELYIHETEPDIDVHFSAQYEGQAQPLVWTRTFGDGRVCYIGPGHRTETMKHASIQEILRRGLIWAIG